MADLDTTAVLRWRAARAAKERAETVLSGAKDLLAEAERALLEEYERAGISSVRLEGRTTFLRREVHVSTRQGARENLINALHDHGLGDLVGATVSAQSLSAYVREQEKLAGAKIPELGVGVPGDIRECINVAEIFRIGERAAG